MEDICPICGQHTKPELDECATCGAQLHAYWMLKSLSWEAHHRAMKYMEEGDPLMALRDSYLAVFLEPGRVEFQVLQAEILRSLGRIDQALEHGEAALDLNEADPHALELVEDLHRARIQAISESREVTAPSGDVPEEKDNPK